MKELDFVIWEITKDIKFVGRSCNTKYDNINVFIEDNYVHITYVDNDWLELFWVYYEYWEVYKISFSRELFEKVDALSYVNEFIEKLKRLLSKK